ncbi:MAG: hypothetical protein HY862_06590 [Chloroflexi bacterium]|nr:hypothetical protein [Chloroflexota bacterium]
MKSAILTFCLLLACVVSLGPIPYVQAAESVTFEDTISTMGNPIPSIIFWRNHEVYAEQGAVLTLTLNAQGSCQCRIGGGNLLVNHSLLGPFSLVSVPTISAVNFASDFVFTYLVTETGYLGLTVELYAGYGGPASPTETITMNYRLTISGVNTPSNTLEVAENLAGLQRVSTDTALPVVIYVPISDAADLFIDIWRLDENNLGYEVLTIPADELLALPDFPAENLLIASTADEFIRVYKLTTGEFQVNVGPLVDGKIHVLIFDGIPSTHTYGYTWEVPAPTP